MSDRMMGGKVLKSEHYSPPNVEAALRHQTARVPTKGGNLIRNALLSEATDLTCESVGLSLSTSTTMIPAGD